MSTYKVEGMTCQGCVTSVTKALQTAFPGNPIEVTLASKRVQIDGDHDPKKVEQCIEDTGFGFAGLAD